MKKMVQQFTNSIKWFWNKTDKYIILLMMLLSFALFFIFKFFHLTEASAINQLLNNLIQFSGIFSAIIITYIISKVFQIRQERIERRKEIVKLSNKVTDFRRIASILVHCYGFWNENMRRKMDNTYKELSFFDIRLGDYDNQEKKYSKELRELRDKYFQETNIPGANFFMDMKSLVLDSNNPWQLELYDSYDHDYTYSLEILQDWTSCHSGGSLWYCLKGNWFDYQNCFNINAFRQNDTEKIIHLATKINSQKFRKRKFDKDLLADIGTEMDSFYLPRLHQLTYYNTLGLSPTLNFLLAILFMTILSGVLAPLLLTAVSVDTQVLLVASSFSVSILSLSLFYFLFKFKRILNNEIKIG